MKKNNFKKGFTILEVMIAMFIFVLMMVAVSSAFSSSFFSYQRARAIQKDLEQAQYAMNLMAKTLRTSTIVSCTNGSFLSNCSSTGSGGGGNYTWIRTYDYSQGECIDYKISGGSVQESFLGTTKANCTSSTSGMATSPLTSSSQNYVTGSFYVYPSFPPPAAFVGRATIFFTICPGNASACSSNSIDQVSIQTSISLRDYSFSRLL